MSLTPRQKELVQETWEQVAPISETAARLFYGRLFETNPHLRPLFTSDMDEQGRKLMQMITVAVQGLDDLDKIESAVRDLGRRHGSYGVKDRDYEAVGEALLWTLEQGLGDNFTLEVEQAWAETYGLLASIMQDGATPVKA